jgi:hypothetical protein
VRETEEGQVVRKRGAMAAKKGWRRWDLICDATQFGEVNLEERDGLTFIT